MYNNRWRSVTGAIFSRRFAIKEGVWWVCIVQLGILPGLNPHQWRYLINKNRRTIGHNITKLDRHALSLVEVQCMPMY